MNVLTRDQQTAVLRALVEGNSMRAVARITGVARNTVAALLRDVGAHCKNHHDRFVRGVAAKRVQADEAWSFCGLKEKRATIEDRAEGRGDAWTWAALDQDSKLVLAYRVGARSAAMAHAFMHDLRDRLTVRAQLDNRCVLAVSLSRRSCLRLEWLRLRTAPKGLRCSAGRRTSLQSSGVHRRRKACGIWKAEVGRCSHIAR